MIFVVSVLLMFSEDCIANNDLQIERILQHTYDCFRTKEAGR
jgi:hypothetical protein